MNDDFKKYLQEQVIIPHAVPMSGDEASRKKPAAKKAAAKKKPQQEDKFWLDLCSTCF